MNSMSLATLLMAVSWMEDEMDEIDRRIDAALDRVAERLQPGFTATQANIFAAAKAAYEARRSRKRETDRAYVQAHRERNIERARAWRIKRKLEAAG